MKKKLIKLFLTSLFILFSCTTTNDNISSTISEADVEIAVVIKGAIINANNSPVDGAFIKIYQDSVAIAIDSVYSSENGEYAFDSINNGNYKITAHHDDSVYAILQNIYINIPKDTVVDTIVVDTLVLQLPGTIVGSVLNYEGDDLIWVYIPGTSYMATVGDTGEFVMSNVAPDSNYTVRFKRDGYATVSISGVSVVSRDTTHLAPQSMTSNSHPLNVIAEYDTLSNSVTLRWDEMERDDIEGYIVSRKNLKYETHLPIVIHDLLIDGLTYVDSLHDTLFSQSDTIEYGYYVQGKIKDSENKTGYSKVIAVNTAIQRDSSDYQSIIVTSPAANDTLIGLNPFEIFWNYTGEIDSVEVFYTLDKGQRWNLISNKILNRGSYYWPQIENAQSNNCQIKVVSCHNNNVVGLSDFFSIKHTPVDNMILNGDFEQGLKSWASYINTFSGAVASIEPDSGSLHVNVVKCHPDSGWMVAVNQYFETPVYLNYKYEISFRAKATKLRNINIAINDLYPDYIYYGGKDTTIDTEWTDYSFTLSLLKDNGEPSVKGTAISFSFGSELGEVWLDDVKMNIVGVRE